MFIKSISKNALSLSLFGIITASCILIVQNTTKTKIEQNIQQAQIKALNQIITATSYNNQLLNDIIHINDEKLGNADIHIARIDNKAIAVIIPTITTEGYTGNIRSIVGVFADGTIANIMVLSHQETPGLGDKIETKKSNWNKQFKGKSITNPPPAQWLVKKDGGVFDQLTGATITPRAVVKSVYNALEYFNNNREQLLAPLKPKNHTQSDLSLIKSNQENDK